MNDAVVPSYRVHRPESGLPWRMLMVAGGLLGAAALGGAGWYAWQSFGGARSVPVVEADPRPFKVRPDDPGGLRVPNQGELILERPSQRAQVQQGARTPSMTPAAETPDLDRLRAAVQSPPPVAVPQAAAPAQPAPASPQAAARQGQAPQPQAAAATQPQAAPATQPQATAAPPAAPAQSAAQPAARPATGRVQVQLGALASEEAARAEWDRLQRRAPELFQGRTPQISRLDRGEGQAPLFRLRTGGLPDQDAAGQFCEQVRARGGACVPIRG